MTTDTQTTTEGTDYIAVTSSRAVFPTPEHEHGGGVDVTGEEFDEIIASPEGGEAGQLTWEWTGETADTRVGESKVIRLTRESFGRERTAEVTVVDLADVEIALRE